MFVCLFFEGSLFTSTLGPFTESMANVFLELASVTEECYVICLVESGGEFRET